MAKCAGCDVIASQKKVTLLRPKANATAGESGLVDLTVAANWQTVGAAWATPKTKGGREAFIFDKVNEQVTSIWDFRYTNLTSQIDSTWRLKLGSRILNINTAYDVDEAGDTIRCECIEVK